METAVEQKLGLFVASYEIGGELMGAPVVRLNLSVNTPEEKINGHAYISQAINPPLNVISRVEGEYTYMCVMPQNCHILVTAQGYPEIKWPKGAGPGPVILPNFELRMILTDDWQSGTANYKYMDNNGKWHQVTNAPVKYIPFNPIQED